MIHSYITFKGCHCGSTYCGYEAKPQDPVYSCLMDVYFLELGNNGFYVWRIPRQFWHICQIVRTIVIVFCHDHCCYCSICYMCHDYYCCRRCVSLSWSLPSWLLRTCYHHYNQECQHEFDQIYSSLEYSVLTFWTFLPLIWLLVLVWLSRIGQD